MAREKQGEQKQLLLLLRPTLYLTTIACKTALEAHIKRMLQYGEGVLRRAIEAFGHGLSVLHSRRGPVYGSMGLKGFEEIS